MLLTFPVDEQTTACIAWGRVRGNRDTDSSSPVFVEECGNGTVKYRFYIGVVNKKVKNNAKKDEWYSEDASVNIWAKQGDTSTRAMGDVTKLLRQRDTVMVFGKYRSYVWTDRYGVIHPGHEITADAVFPTVWLYHVLLALFTDVIAKSAPPTTRTVKGAPAPKKQEQKVPQITHPTVMDEKDGWFQ